MLELPSTTGKYNGTKYQGYHAVVDNVEKIDVVDLEVLEVGCERKHGLMSSDHDTTYEHEDI